jgi:hypothetical protein
LHHPRTASSRSHPLIHNDIQTAKPSTQKDDFFSVSFESEARIRTPAAMQMAMKDSTFPPTRSREIS